MTNDGHDIIGKILGYTSIVLYIISFISEKTKMLMFIAIWIPWLSFIVSIPVAKIITESNKKNVVFTIYFVFALLFFIAASFITKSILPHIFSLLCCISYILCEYIDRYKKQVDQLIKEKKDILKYTDQMSERINNKLSHLDVYSIKEESIIFELNKTIRSINEQTASFYKKYEKDLDNLYEF